MTLFIDIDPGKFASDFGKMLAKLAHRFVLNARGNDVTAIRVLLEKTTDCPVV